MASCHGADTTCWLSFADDSRHLGAVLVDGVGFGPALVTATHLGLNPGGECVGINIDRDAIPPEYVGAFAAIPRLKLLSLDELRVLGPMLNIDGDER